MDINNILQKLNNKHFEIELEDIPEIDLYMDQVIQLFESKLGDSKRNPDDKLMTKTMINNYAKADLLMSIKNKKYSKEHLILISLIYELKGTISISDIKRILEYIVEKYESNSEYDLRKLYSDYLKICEEDNNSIREEVKQKINNFKEEQSFEEKFILVASMISISNIYRRISEMLIDEFFNEEEKNK